MPDKIQYVVASTGDKKVITVFVEGDMFIADSTQPNFAAIIAAAEAGNAAELPALFDASIAVAEKFEKLSERVSVANGRIYFDGDEVDNSLTTQVIRFRDEGVEDYKPLVKFFEKVQQNPSEHSREQLYEWLRRHAFTITDEGDLLGYKGVTMNLTSLRSGPAIVDGEPFNGYVPNKIGSVIEIARSSVTADSSVGCSSGLHVGTHKYAAGYGNVLLEVHVNPRDVVSVPTDCDAQKVRVCRYTVIGKCSGRVDAAVRSATPAADLVEPTRDALRREAALLGIPGRGSMRKVELLAAVKAAK